MLAFASRFSKKVVVRNFHSSVATRSYESRQGQDFQRRDSQPKPSRSTPVDYIPLDFMPDDKDPAATQEWRKSNNISVVGLGVKCPPPLLSFDDAPFLQTAKDTLKSMYNEPTPIQSQGWAIAMAGENMVGVAKTGSGKTMAFILPALEHIYKQQHHGRGRSGPRALVLAPTRELAQQIEAEINQIVGKYRMKVLCVFGGSGNRGTQIRQLRFAEPNIVVATPGRLVDLNDAGFVDLSNVTCLVLDEADRMLDMGFGPQLKEILARIPGEESRQTLMWTATWDEEIEAIARASFRNYVRLNVGSDKLSANENIKQEILLIKNHERYDHLTDILSKNPDKKFLVFVSRKIDCEHIGSMLYHGLGIKQLAAIHGDKTQEQRNNIIEDFRKSVLRIVVATDVAARGLDVKDIDFVINYDFPQDMATYVHRIGRTARAGKIGTAISFFTPEYYGSIKQLMEQMKLSKQVIPTELLELQRQIADSRQQPSKRGGSRQQPQRRSSNPYGDKFSQAKPSTSPKSFDTDDWIMNKGRQQHQHQQSSSYSSLRTGGNRRPSRPSYENEFNDDSEDDAETFDFLNKKKSYGNRSAPSPSSSADGKPKFSSFEELMQSLKSTKK